MRMNHKVSPFHFLPLFLRRRKKKKGQYNCCTKGNALILILMLYTQLIFNSPVLKRKSENLFEKRFLYLQKPITYWVFIWLWYILYNEKDILLCCTKRQIKAFMRILITIGGPFTYQNWAIFVTCCIKSFFYFQFFFTSFFFFFPVRKQIFIKTYK